MKKIKNEEDAVVVSSGAGDDEFSKIKNPKSDLKRSSFIASLHFHHIFLLLYVFLNAFLI